MCLVLPQNYHHCFAKQYELLKHEKLQNVILQDQAVLELQIDQNNVLRVLTNAQEPLA